MKITVETCSNGIHSYLSTSYTDITVKDLEVVSKIAKLTDDYNECQVESA